MFGQHQQGLAEILSAGFAVILVTSVHGRVHHWIERRFQKGVYRLKAQLPELLDALCLRMGAAELCEAVLNEIVRDVRAIKAAILVRGESGLYLAAGRDVDEADVGPWLAPHAFEAPPETPQDEEPMFNVALPLVDALKDEPIGWLLVGPRPDGTSCNRDERNALAAVAGPIARSVATVRAREDREERLLARLSALEARLVT